MGITNNGRHVTEEADDDTTPINGYESPPSTAVDFDSKLPVASPKKTSGSRRATQKRVVSVPIKEAEGSRFKGDNGSNTPPSDSWAWRKYGQKPIKGSPYPRGYYRCSSSKGCPARKQVERSPVDPGLLIITYSSEHNHPGPTARKTYHRHSAVNPAPVKSEDPDPTPEQRFTDLGAEKSLITAGEDFSWFGDMETTTSTVMESPLLDEKSAAAGVGAADVAMFFPVGAEDESLFADLDELPECSVVFRRSGGPIERAEQRTQSCGSTWWGTTG